MASRLLEALNCTVEIASSGLQTLDLLKQNPTCYDCVLMDLNLPVMDGMETAAHIRKDARLNNIALIGFSSNQNLNREQVLEMSFDGWLSKPYKFM